MMGIENWELGSKSARATSCGSVPPKMMWPAKMREAGDAKIATSKTKDPFPSFGNTHHYPTEYLGTTFTRGTKMPRGMK